MWQQIQLCCSVRESPGSMAHTLTVNCFLTLQPRACLKVSINMLIQLFFTAMEGMSFLFTIKTGIKLYNSFPVLLLIPAVFQFYTHP